MEEENKICTCPVCGGNIIKGRYNYECENTECSFKFSKIFFGVDISEELMTSLCNGGISDTYTFRKTDKEWNAKLKYKTEEKRIGFVFDDNIVGTCPVCKGKIKETQKYFLCENYKKTCNTIIAKDVGGNIITKEDAIKLLNGEILPEMTFMWHSGKTGKGKLKLSNEGKIEYIFE